MQLVVPDDGLGWSQVAPGDLRPGLARPGRNGADRGQEGLKRVKDC